MNVGLAYQIRTSLSLTLDVPNLFNEPQKLYAGVPGRTQDIIFNS